MSTWADFDIDAGADPPEIIAVKRGTADIVLGTACAVDGAPHIRWLTLTPAQGGIEVSQGEPVPLDLDENDLIVTAVEPAVFWRYLQRRAAAQGAG